MLVSATGFVLVKRWAAPVDMLTLVSWQLVVGGLALVPLTLLVEGAPPALDARALAGFTWLAVVGTGLAYWCWFAGLSRMPAGSAALIGLVNPVVGTLLGVVVAHEVFGLPQLAGVVLVLGGALAGQLAGSAPRSAAATAATRLPNPPAGIRPVERRSRFLGERSRVRRVSISGRGYLG